MTIRSFIEEFHSALKEHYAEGERGHLLRLIFQDKMQFKSIDLSMRKEEELAASDLEQLRSITKELQSGKPIQYILGHVWFAGLQLKVTPAVLIPRQETEELVDWIVKENEKSSPVIFDICSGSGCIGIALKKLIPDSLITGIDVSADAIRLSEENSTTLQLKVEFLCKDILLEDLPFNEVDVIVSNPPYIRVSESRFMKANVLDHEPHLALFVPENDPLLFYKRIAFLAFQSLKKGGKLYFEINENLSAETSQILELQGFHDITVRKDLNDKFRMIRAIR